MGTGLEKSVFIPNLRKGNTKECSNYHTIALISYASKVMLKILQFRLQQYMNWEIPDVQAEFRKGRGTRDQIANIHWIIEKASENEFSQSCPTLWDPMDYTVYGILQARILEWVAFPFSRGSFQPASQADSLPAEPQGKSNMLVQAMLKNFQVRLQHYVRHEIPDLQAEFRKGKGTRDQVANICWIIEKAREFQKNIYLCLIDYEKAFDCADHNKLWKIL